MACYVCSGAKLRCSMGSEESKLEVVHLEKPVLLCGKPMANIMDYKSMANIKPFGQCCSLANPVVAAATAANNGVLREMRCVPNPIFPWMPGKPNLLIKGQPALLDNCTCGCAWAGPIKITDPGQNTVYEGGPMTITITDPTVETLQSLEGMGGNDGVRGALGSGFQPADLLPSLQTAIGDVQMPQIPSFVTEMKDSVSVKTKIKNNPRMAILSGWALIAESDDHERGRYRNGPLADDMYCGDMTKTDIFLKFPRRILDVIIEAKFGDVNFHFNKFEFMATYFFSRNNVKLHKVEFPKNLSEKCRIIEESPIHRVNLQSNIISMIKHFRTSINEADYSNPTLTDAVTSHEETIRFFNEIREELRNRLITHRGDISQIEKKKLKQFTRPKYDTWTFPFQGDKFDGLTIALNDTWAYEVLITKYQAEQDGPYKGIMKIVIYDHFGLDNNDVNTLKPANFFEGFFHWFALQRWEGFHKKYKPFVTVIEKELEFEGNWTQL